MKARWSMSAPRTLAGAMLALSLVTAGCRQRGDGPQDGGVGEARCPDEMLQTGLDLPAARAAYRHHLRRHELRMLEALRPGSTLETLASNLTTHPGAPAQCLSDLQQAGRIVFEHEFSYSDGLAAGESARMSSETSRGPFTRVQSDSGGPETLSCTSCHWRGGLAGAGEIVDNTFLLGDGEHITSADARNPPPLHGVAVVELLAREMSAELAEQRRTARAQAMRTGETTEVSLTAKGVAFGRLTARPDGTLDTEDVAGVDADLIVRPFGWKGNFETLPEFIVESLQVHFGIQATALATAGQQTDPKLIGKGPPEDPDQDGVEDELPDALLVSMIAYLAALPLPVVEPWEPLPPLEPVAEPLPPPNARRFGEPWARGRELFSELGCATCHQPMLVLHDPTYRLQIGHERVEIDLARSGAAPRLQYDPQLGGYPVWLFSDLRRHNLGDRNRSQHVHRGVARAEYQTRRLWGLAHSAPYLHDGRAPDLDTAIAGHDGEARGVSEAFEGLAFEDQGALRVYLLSLRRAASLMIP